MKSLRTISMVFVLSTMLFAVTAQAAPKVAVYIGEENFTEATIPKTTIVPLNIYLHDVEASINAVEYKLNLPPGLIIMSDEWGFPGTVDFGDDTVGYAYGLGDCVPMYASNDRTQVLVHTVNVYSMGYSDFQPITFSAFEGGGDSPTAPRISHCDGSLHYLDTQGASISVSVVRNDDQSWGAVKSLY